MRFLLLFWTLLFSLLPHAAMAIEEPKFEVLEQSESFELRQYHPLIVAEVLVDGDLDEASSKGFRLIADYIFGNNRANTGANAKIAMTAPVTVEPIDNKIAMTAPVTLQPKSGKWQVRFVMPSQYTLSTLPVPNNTQVKLREVPGRKVFSFMAPAFVIAFNTFRHVAVGYPIKRIHGVVDHLFCRSHHLVDAFGQRSEKAFLAGEVDALGQVAL